MHYDSGGFSYSDLHAIGLVFECDAIRDGLRVLAWLVRDDD